MDREKLAGRIAFAHAGSYLAGLVGGLLLIVKTWKRRGRLVAA